MRYVIKKPKECSEQELKDFYDFIVRGGEVNPGGLENRIKKAYLLGFCYNKNELVSISALKQANVLYRDRVFKSSRLSGNLAHEYTIESGWYFTKPDYRRQGISLHLLQEMLRSADEEKIFATVRTENKAARSLVKKEGFKQAGIPFKSSRGDYFLQLFVR